MLTPDVFWAIYTTRNKITFEVFVLRSVVSVIFNICLFLNYCAGLYLKEEAVKMKMEAKATD
jgi:hypothetical protein